MKTIHIVEESLPMAWERAVLACWNEGDAFPTEYDKPNDPNSRDVCALIHVKNPMTEPRIHRAQCLSMADLEKYRNEVVVGVHDYFMNDLTNENRWLYTYHDRMTSYDQINKCVSILKECPYSRRAKIDIWNKESDLGAEHPPCLQYLTLRVENGKLNLIGHIRSNDAYKAAFCNLWAISELQKEIAEQLLVGVGELVWVADSFHVYGSYFGEFEGFLKTVKTRAFADRTWHTSNCIEYFIEGCQELLTEERMPSDKKEKILERKNYLQRMLA